MASTRRALSQSWRFARCNYGGCRCFATTDNAARLSAAIADGGGSEAEKSRPRVVVAMSGGVDSSVAAYLLRRQAKSGDAGAANRNAGVDVIGLHMSNWNALDEDSDEGASNSNKHHEQRRRGRKQDGFKDNAARASRPSSSAFCEASEKEYNDARSVAEHLSMPLHRVSFASEYWIQVFEPFVESISSASSFSSNGEIDGKNSGVVMPNPDFGCNTYIKFGAMKEYAIDRLQADYVATGHYAQLWHRDGTAPPLGGNSSFYDWMEKSSRALEQSVRESIAGLPEEEWILENSRSRGQHTDASRHPMLIAGADRSKDQSYFLSGVKAEAFRNVIFPLGHLSKSQSTAGNSTSSTISDDAPRQSVRDIAREASIPTASKRDSMGICFIGKRNFGNFVSQYLPEPTRPGTFVDVDTGEVVGQHDGAMHYTIGQGAKISGSKVRYFVCGKGERGSDESNTVFVCNSTHHPALYADELHVDFDSFNWIGLGSDGREGELDRIPRPLAENEPIKLLARTRHLQPLASCTVMWKRDGSSSHCSRERLVVHFDNPMRAITPGQIVALYAGRDGLICLGGGPIQGRGASFMDRGINISQSALHPSGHNDLSLANRHTA